MNYSQTQQELLDNTVKYYSEDTSRRATNLCTRECEYITSDGRKCAIGRELENPTEELNDMGSVSFIEYHLPQRLLNMEVDFLERIQILHDDNNYWTLDGLSAKGIAKVSSIARKYNLKNPLEWLQKN